MADTITLQANGSLSLTSAPLKPMLAGEISPAAAVERGLVRITGEPDLLARFVEVFRIHPAAATATPGPGALDQPA